VGGFDDGMRTKEPFVVYMRSRLEVGIARGNSTLTVQRSALALREKVERREPWRDNPETR